MNSPETSTSVLARVLPVSLLLLALAAATTAFGIDYVRPGGTGGFGLAQTVMLLVAVAAAMGSVEFISPEGRASLAARPSLLAREQGVALARHAIIFGQLVLLVVVARTFRIESPAFHDKILVLTAAGFVIHSALPRRQRMTFFLLLSLSGIYLVFGVTGGLWLVCIGCILAAICHLPTAYFTRVALLVMVGGVLALMRGGVWAGPVPDAIWPILGSMFMFRLIAYMYDLRHAKESSDWRSTLSYFFLLPNVVFPLFPVVDWTMFRRTYYDRESYQIYQRGVLWMTRGLTHLLIYRAVDSYMALSPAQVSNGSDLARFLVANYLLYLRVSGQFHLIVGMLHLFGFRLPETHRWFFLASSFTDFWRRINIYWKDFMMKVVYYPAFFELRRFGMLPGIIGATLLVFFATWFLHAYQWFWLLGSVLLTWPDVLFWSVLAFFLVINTVLDMRRRQRAQKEPFDGSVRAYAQRAVQTVVFFAAMCVLWSLWSSESVSEWLGMWSAVLGTNGG